MKFLKTVAFLFIIILISVWCTEVTFAQKKAAPEDIDSLVSGITGSIFQVCPVNTVFAYAVVREGKVRFYGFENIPHQQATVVKNEDAVFEIGSISKVFTSILLADLLVRNKVNMHTTIDNYFDNRLKTGKDITLIQLANHSSGFPRVPVNLPVSVLNPYRDYSAVLLKEYLETDLETGTVGQYSYSNLGMATLAYCISRESGLTYEAYLQKLIFQPLKMQHSSTDLDLLRAYLVSGRDSSGAATSNWDMNAFAGAGGIKSSVRDLSQLVLAYFNDNNPVLNKTLEPTLEVNSQMFLGLGWHGIKKDANRTWYFHNGGTNGYSSSILMDVRNKNAVIILTNLSAFHPYFPYIDKTAISIMNRICR